MFFLFVEVDSFHVERFYLMIEAVLQYIWLDILFMNSRLELEILWHLWKSLKCTSVTLVEVQFKLQVCIDFSDMEINRRRRKLALINRFCDDT